jgi:hypothetical protein
LYTAFMYSMTRKCQNLQGLHSYFRCSPYNRKQDIMIPDVSILSKCCAIAIIFIWAMLQKILLYFRQQNLFC